MDKETLTTEVSLEYRFADFVIDVSRYELRRAGMVVPIEPQVFDVLVHLVRNHNRIVSKNELVDVVWNGRAISDAALSARISAARRAIGDSGADQRTIRTHHKRGFRFVGTVNSVAALTAATPARGLAESQKTPLAPEPTDRPSIAVLPFQNMSCDPEQEYFVDGLTEDIITDLSRYRWLFVVARNSSFSFKGKTADVRSVANELGARYVLDGSARKSADRVRVSAQLIDPSNGIHLWADRYDQISTGIFEWQDEITSQIINSAVSQIVVAEAARGQCGPSCAVPRSMNVQNVSRKNQGDPKAVLKPVI